MRYFILVATTALIVGFSLPAGAGLLAGRGQTGSVPVPQVISAITPSSCSFTAGTQNGPVCDLGVTMSPSTPGSTAALSLTGTNSGGFHLIGSGCGNIALGNCTIVQSAGVGGTQASVNPYTDVSVVATQAGISNSPKTQQMSLTANAVVAGSPGLLHVSTDNRRYFATQDSNAVYLTGNHTWTSGQSFQNLGPFSFTAMVDYMKTLNVNLIRHWDQWFATVDVLSGFGAITTPLPFNRSGTCCANDGGNKFNLNSINQAYFDKLKSEVEYAGSKGMYIMPLLFNPVEYRGDFSSWATDYWNGANNTNGTTTDYFTAIEGGDATLLALQQAYLRKFLDTLGAETNVLYEVANELGFGHNSTAVYTYQEGIVSLVHSYEASQGYLHHPVGIEYVPINNASIPTSPADFLILYNGESPALLYNLGKPIVVDSDHEFGIGGGTDWWWKGFVNGDNMLSMDDMRGTGLTGITNFLDGDARLPAMLQNRPAITQTRTLTAMMDMTGMSPRPELASTGYALADTINDQYIVYAGSGGTITVDLSADSGVSLTAKWLNTADGSLSGATTVTSGSASQSFTSPYGSNPTALVIVGPPVTRISGISLIPVGGAATPPAPPTIVSISSSSLSFVAQAGNANTTVGTLSAAVSSGSFGGTFALATASGCPGTNNASFAVSGSTLKVGASDVTVAQNYNICVRATDVAFGNSPFFQSLTLNGFAASGAATILPTPPPGKSWVQTFGDEFSSAFNTSVWDVDHAGGSSNATDTTSGGILTMTIDTNPATRNIIDTWTTSGGTGNHAFSQRYGYFVYRIKLPTCTSAEYDVEFFGRDNWTTDSRGAGAYAELGIASGQSECNYRNLRPYEGYGSGSFSFMSDPDVGVDVTLGYHQYGVNWVNDGSAHGSVTMYFDGAPFSGPTQLISPGWDVGMFFDLYWSPIVPGGALGGSDGVAHGGSIMQVDWVRAYQLQ